MNEIIEALRDFAKAAARLAEALEASEPAPAIVATEPELGELMLSRVSELFRMKPERIVGRGMTSDVLPVRQALAYVMRSHFDWSYPRIGELLERDHSTIMNSVRAVSKWSPEARERYVTPITSAAADLETDPDGD